MTKLTGIIMSENKLTGSLGVRNKINVDIIGTGARGKGYLRARVGSKWPFAPYLMLKNRLWALINSAIGSKYQESREAPSEPTIMRYRNNCSFILF